MKLHDMCADWLREFGVPPEDLKKEADHLASRFIAWQHEETFSHRSYMREYMRAYRAKNGAAPRKKPDTVSELP